MEEKSPRDISGRQEQLSAAPPKDHDPNTYAVIGAAMEMHRQLGCGFLEAVYQQVLAIELGLRGIPFQREVELAVQYKGQTLPTSYRADFVCFGDLRVELKALSALGSIEESQIINYLKAARKPTGLLLNFGIRSLQHKRFVSSLAASVQSAVMPFESV